MPDDSHVAPRDALRIPARPALAGLLAASLACVATAAAVSWAPGRIVAGCLLLLIAPGALAVQAWQPDLSDGRVRLVASLGLSIVVSMAAGIAVAAVTDDVEATPVAIVIGGACVVLFALALARTPASATLGTLPRRRPSRTQFVALVPFLAALAGLGILIALLFDTSAKPTRFTALSSVDGSGGRLVRIENHEGRPRQFAWEVLAGGHRVARGGVHVDDRTTTLLRLPRVRESGTVTMTLFVDYGARTSRVPYRTITVRPG